MTGKVVKNEEEFRTFIEDTCRYHDADERMADIEKTKTYPAYADYYFDNQDWRLEITAYPLLEKIEAMEREVAKLRAYL